MPSRPGVQGVHEHHVGFQPARPGARPRGRRRPHRRPPARARLDSSIFSPARTIASSSASSTRITGPPRASGNVATTSKPPPSRSPVRRSPPEHRHPLAHPDQPVAARSSGRGGAGAVVGDEVGSLAVAVRRPGRRRALAPASLQHVGQRLLGDPVGRHVQTGRQVDRLAVDGERRRPARWSARGRRGRRCGAGRAAARAGRYVAGAQDADHPADLVDAAPAQLLDLAPSAYALHRPCPTAAGAAPRPAGSSRSRCARRRRAAPGRSGRARRRRRPARWPPARRPARRPARSARGSGAARGATGSPAPSRTRRARRRTRTPSCSHRPPAARGPGRPPPRRRRPASAGVGCW